MKWKIYRDDSLSFIINSFPSYVGAQNSLPFPLERRKKKNKKEKLNILLMESSFINQSTNKRSSIEMSRAMKCRNGALDFDKY